MVVGLAGCRNKDYSRSIENGLNAVAENKYQKALTYFDNALTQKPKDAQAQAYRNQTQAYLTTKAKLKRLKTTVTSDYQEYQQLSDDIQAQLKVKNGKYLADVLKRCAAINWHKKALFESIEA